MTLLRHRSPRWRRRCLRLLLLILAAPVLLVALADAWFSMPWGRRALAAKISARVHAPVTLGPVYWTPWTGGVVRSVRVDAPTAGQPPWIQTGRIEADPDWRGIFQGHRSLSRVCVEDPDIVISPAIFAALLQGAETTEPPTLSGHRPDTAGNPGEVTPALSPPGVGGVPNEVPPIAQVPEMAPVVPPTALSSGSPEPPVESKPATLSKPEEASAPVALPPPDTRKPLWIEVRRGRLRLLASGAVAPIAEAHDLNLRVPFQGPDAIGEISLGRFDLDGHSLAANLKLPLHWRSPELRLENQALKFAGMDWKALVRFGRIPGLPFLMDLRAASQTLPPTELSGGRRLGASEVEVLGQLAGSLPAPSTWRGQLLAKTSDFKVECGSKPQHFDRGEWVMLLGGGVLRCPEMRLIGEDLSVLGNGFVAKGGATAAVLRFVIPLETAEIWIQKLKGFDPEIQIQFTALESPARVALDLSLVSSGSGPAFELGPQGSVVPLAVLLSLFGN